MIPSSNKSWWLGSKSWMLLWGFFGLRLLAMLSLCQKYTLHIIKNFPHADLVLIRQQRDDLIPQNSSRLFWIGVPVKSILRGHLIAKSASIVFEPPEAFNLWPSSQTKMSQNPAKSLQCFLMLSYEAIMTLFRHPNLNSVTYSIIIASISFWDKYSEDWESCSHNTNLDIKNMWSEFKTISPIRNSSQSTTIVWKAHKQWR